MDEILHIPQETDGESLALRLRSWAQAAGAAIQAGVKRFQHWSDAATAGGGRIISPLHFLAAAAVLGVAAVVTTVYTPAYVVELDGVALGTVASKQVFEQTVDRVEARATEILGYDYTLDGDITYSLALTEPENITPTADFETYLFDQIGDVMKNYVLTVNGQFIGAAQDRDTITSVLDQVKSSYINENTISAEFTSGVYITHEYTASDVEQDSDAMLAALTANQNGQTTYEVQKGDTFVDIASANNMTLSELEALNPDVDSSRIYIGQIINVKEEVPFLSVKTVDHITYTESIECPVVEVEDGSMYQGQSKVLDAGTPGEQVVTADVSYLNGVEQERNVLSTVRPLTRSSPSAPRCGPPGCPPAPTSGPCTATSPPASATAPSSAPTATIAAWISPLPTALPSRPPTAAPSSGPAPAPAATGVMASTSSSTTATACRPTTPTVPACWSPPATRSIRVRPLPR